MGVHKEGRPERHRSAGRRMPDENPVPDTGGHMVWELLAEAVAEAVVRLDATGRILFANPAAGRMAPDNPARGCGGTPRQAGWQEPLCVFLERHLPEALADGRRRSGRIRWADSSADVRLIPFSDGAAALVVVQPAAIPLQTPADVPYRRLLESLPLPVFVHSQGRFIYLNPAAVHLHGARRAADLAGRRLLDFVHPGSRPLMEARLRDLPSCDPAPVLTELRLLSLDGREVDVEVTALPIFFEGRDARLAICRDVTRSRRMAAALEARERDREEQARHLAEANQALRALLEHREAELRSAEHALLSRIEQIIRPHLERMAQTASRSEWLVQLDLLRTSLQDLLNPLSRGLQSLYRSLTPAEIEVAELIRNGKSSKEIAALLRVSPSTVAFHRYRLREKLSLQGTGTNLAAFLKSLSA